MRQSVAVECVQATCFKFLQPPTDAANPLRHLLPGGSEPDGGALGGGPAKSPGNWLRDDSRSRKNLGAIRCFKHPRLSHRRRCVAVQRLGQGRWAAGRVRLQRSTQCRVVPPYPHPNAPARWPHRVCRESACRVIDSVLFNAPPKSSYTIRPASSPFPSTNTSDGRVFGKNIIPAEF